MAFFKDRGLGVPSIALFLYLFTPKETAEGFLYFSRRPGSPLVIFDLPSSHRSWKGRYFLLVAEVGNMTFLTKMTPWASRWLGSPLKIFVSVGSVFGMTCARSLNISDHVFPSCFSGARIDLSDEDDAIALILAECPARPYAELIKSSIPGPSNLKPARPAALRSLPPSMRVSSIGPSAATPTRGELLAQLETLYRKPRSVKRKTSGFAEKGRPALAKVPRLGASSSSSSTPVQKQEPAPSPVAEAPIVLSLQPPSKSAAK